MTQLLTNSELIKAEIARLHERGSSDWQSLMRQVANYHQKERVVTYNTPQLVSMEMKKRLPDFKMHYDRWGRGTGKTTMIGAELIESAKQMPRGVGQFISPSYKMFLTRIIPSLRDGLETFGLYEGLHYFIGEKVPRAWKWDLPYKAPKDFSHFVHFINGFGFYLISQDVPGDGRGLRTDVELSDESALLDWEMRNENNGPAMIMGSKPGMFEDKPFFQKMFYHSSMALTMSGAYVFELEQQNMEEPTVYIVDATPKENEFIPDVESYLKEERKRASSDIVFNAEYLNERPPLMGEGSFYSLFDEKKHGYRQIDNGFYQKIGQSQDCRGDYAANNLLKSEPLVVCMDFGVVINSGVVAHNIRHNADGKREFRCLKDFFILGREGKILQDLVKDILDYYEPHKTFNDEIKFYYDNSGNIRTPTEMDSMSDIVTKMMRVAGWRVKKLTFGKKNPDHEPKFRLYENIFREDNPRFPVFRINLLDCKNTIISMGNAGVKRSSANKVIQKVKRSEGRLKNKNRQHATDLSDAMDSGVHGIYGEMANFGEVWMPA